jgi:hypothetical protein
MKRTPESRVNDATENDHSGAKILHGFPATLSTSSRARGRCYSDAIEELDVVSSCGDVEEPIATGKHELFLERVYGIDICPDHPHLRVIEHEQLNIQPIDSVTQIKFIYLVRPPRGGWLHYHPVSLQTLPTVVPAR